MILVFFIVAIFIDLEKLALIITFWMIIEGKICFLCDTLTMLERISKRMQDVEIETIYLTMLVSVTATITLVEGVAFRTLILA